MITLNTYYTSDELLNEFLEAHNLQDSSKLLIQIFTARNDFDFITKLTNFFSIHFPLSTLIWATTDALNYMLYYFLFIKIFPKRYDVYRFARLFLIIGNDRFLAQAELF
jgi:hypothetical protein